MLDANSCPDVLAAGAFAVAKSKVKERLIGDRPPRNAISSSMKVAKIPFAPRLRRLLISKRPDCTRFVP